MDVIGPISTGIASGGAGAAAANSDSRVRVRGRLLGFHVKYLDSPPATTDVIIKSVGTASGAPPTQTYLTLTDKNTNGLFLPRVIPDDTLGVDLATLTVAEPFICDDFVNISIAQANDGDSAEVTIYLE